MGNKKTVNEQMTDIAQHLDAKASASEAQTEATSPLTPEVIEDRIDGVMTVLASLFYDPEERVEGDNGKLYPLDYDFDGRVDVSSTGNIVTCDRFRYLDSQAAAILPQGLEFMLRRQQQNIANQRDAIQKAIAFGRNAGADVDGEVERKADFLEAMLEQEALLRIALHRAAEGYHTATGTPYLTKEQREQAAAARRASVGTDRRERLAKLGVDIG